MSKFKKGDRVLLSTVGRRDTTVTNLDASKLAPRFIGPFRVLKVISDAYTLDILSSLRLHPKFYIGRLKEYRPTTLHWLISMPNAGSYNLIALSAVPYAPMTSAAIVPPPAHVQEPGVTSYTTVRAARDSTAESHLQFSLPFQPAQEQPQLPAGRQPPCSQLHQRRSEQPGRQLYALKGPLPLVDAEGQFLWIVEYIVGHEDPHREATSTAREIARDSIRGQVSYTMAWVFT